MAGYGGQLVALNANTPQETADQWAQVEQRQAQTSQLGAQTQSQLAELPGIQAKSSMLQSAVAPAQAEDQAKVQSFRDAQIGRAAATALDPQSWDTQMAALAAAGNTAAQQFVGRYSPVLQERIAASYGGGSQLATAAGAPASAQGQDPNSDAAYDLKFSTYTPQQFIQAKQVNDKILSALSGVKDQATQDQAVQWLAQNGVPNAAQLVGPYSPFAIRDMYHHVLGQDQYISRRVGDLTTGTPNPIIPNKVETLSDGRVVAVNPQGTSAKILVQPVPKTAASPTGDLYQENAAPPGTGVSGADYASRLIGTTEGTTRNPASTANGPGQFLGNDRSAFIPIFKQLHPDLAQGKTNAQILAYRTQGNYGVEATVAYAQQNAALLPQGVPATTSSLAVMHQLGASDGPKVLSAAADTPLKNILSPKVLAANPTWKNLTAGDYYRTIEAKMGNDRVSFGGAQTASAGSTSSLTPEALDYAAQQYMLDGTLPSMGSGAIGGVHRAQIMNRAAQLEAETGATGADAVTRHATIKAATSALGNLQQSTAIMQSNAEAANRNADLMVSLAPKGGGQTGSPVINRWLQAGRKATGDPDVVSFDNALSGFSEQYAKVMTGATGAAAASDSAREAAFDRLSKYATQGQLAAGVSTMRKEMANDLAAREAETSHLQATIKGGGVVPQGPAPATPASVPAPIHGMTAQQMAVIPQFRGATDHVGTPKNPYVTTNASQYAKLPAGAYYLYTDGRVLVKH